MPPTAVKLIDVDAEVCKNHAFKTVCVKAVGQKVEQGIHFCFCKWELELRAARQRDKQAARGWYKDWKKCKKKMRAYQREGRVKHFLSSGLIYGYWEHKSFRSPRTPSPVIYSPEHISKSKLGGTKNTFFGCGQICEDSRNMNHKSKTAKCQSCKSVGALFKFSQVQIQSAASTF